MSVADQSRQAPWRFQRHSGEWWYYNPNGNWMYHRNGQWNNFAEHNYQPPTGYGGAVQHQTGFRGAIEGNGPSLGAGVATQLYTDHAGREFIVKNGTRLYVTPGGTMGAGAQAGVQTTPQPTLSGQAGVGAAMQGNQAPQGNIGAGANAAVGGSRDALNAGVNAAGSAAGRSAHGGVDIGAQAEQAAAAGTAKEKMDAEANASGVGVQGDGAAGQSQQ